MKRFKKFITAALAVSMIMGSSMNAMAGNWQQNSTGWWYQEDNGAYPTNTWKWIDGKSYYFNGNGYMLANATTPDGYQVDASGAWVVNGVVQTQGSVTTNTDAYDPNYPLKGYVEAFGLLDVTVTTRGMWSNKETHYDVKRGKTIGYSRRYLVNALTGEYHGEANPDEFDYALTAEVKKFLNSFDWRNADDWTKAQRCLEWVAKITPTDGKYDEDAYHIYSLVSGSATCQGFSANYKLLANLVGLEATNCTSKTKYLHTENSVKINGQWYLMDTIVVATSSVSMNSAIPVSGPVLD